MPSVPKSDGLSPMIVETPDSADGGAKKDKVQLKKELGLLEGVAIILGIIFGSGIFITPPDVAQCAGSVGLSLTVWVLCGVMSMIGALCYAELGTSIPKSGGDYAYLFEVFGPLPAFLYLWAAMLIFVPTTNAIMGMAFAQYVIKPFFCEDMPDVAIKMIAALVICFLTFINSFNVRATTQVQNVFMFAKFGALIFIIVMGIGRLILYGSPEFNHVWENTETNVGKIALSFYGGIFSYSGWNYLNFMTEELKNPYVNLPRAIYISLPIVTLIYTVANVAYFAVIPLNELKASPAIAVTFGDQVMGMFAWMMPFMVALSAFGGLSVHIMTSSRMCFVGARYGHFPAMLSHISVSHFTPMPSLVFLNLLSLLMLVAGDVNTLITYSSFVESFFIMLSVGGILYLRYTQPKLNRPIKVSLWVPIFFILICIFLLVTPILQRPYIVGTAVCIVLSGIPAYFVGVIWQDKPEWFSKSLDEVTCFVQKLFLSAREEKED